MLYIIVLKCIIGYLHVCVYGICSIYCMCCGISCLYAYVCRYVCMCVVCEVFVGGMYGACACVT